MGERGSPREDSLPATKLCPGGLGRLVKRIEKNVVPERLVGDGPAGDEGVVRVPHHGLIARPPCYSASSKGDPLSRNNRSPMRKSPIGIRRMREEAEVRWQPGPPLSTSYASESPDSTTAGGESRSCLSDSGRNASTSRHSASLDASTVGGGRSGPRPALTGMTLAVAAWLGFLSAARLRTSSSWFHPGIGRFRCRILGLRSRCSSVRPRGRLSGRRWSRMKCWPRRKSVGARTSPCFCSAAGVVAAVQITRSRMLRPRRA